MASKKTAWDCVNFLMESKEKMVSGKKLRTSVLMPESVDMVESAVKRTQVSVV